MLSSRTLSCLLSALFFLLGSCASDADVHLYVALDQQHSEALIKTFESETGLKVRARFDTEAQKTVGLVSAILEEKERPRCDVFWNNELAQTVRLAQKDMLQENVTAVGADIPERYRDPDGLWYGFAARARIFIVNTDRIPDPADYPKSIWDLADPKWKGKCGIAKPLTGTTLTHFTALRLTMGDAKLAEFLAALKANEVVFLGSNAATMRETAAGKLAFALTDTDDYHVAMQKGNPVTAVFPDQGEGQIGTMLIPNSVSMIRNGPHPDGARRLIDFILSKRVEALLAAAKSAQIPLRPGVEGPKDPRILGIESFRQMEWSPAATARALTSAAKYFAVEFGG